MLIDKGPGRCQYQDLGFRKVPESMCCEDHSDVGLAQASRQHTKSVLVEAGLKDVELVFPGLHGTLLQQFIVQNRRPLGHNKYLLPHNIN